MQELAQAMMIYHKLAAPLPPAVAGKFFSIRGVKSGPADTVGSITWHLLPSPPSPIKDSSVVPGDGIQPAWTTRLAKPGMNAPITVTADIDHMFMMESPLTQQALVAPLGIQETAMERKPPRPVQVIEPATSEEALAFVRDLHKLGGKRTLADQARVAAFVNSLPLGTLKGIARRIMMDIMKAPPPRGAGPGRRGERKLRRGGKGKKKSPPRAKKTKAAPPKTRPAPKRGQAAPSPRPRAHPGHRRP